MRRRALAGVILLGLAGCDAGAPPPRGATARFDVAESPVALDAAPFPGDFRRDADGTIALGAVPSPRGEGALFDRLRALLAARDGFCASCGVSFPIEGAIDPSSLPRATEGAIDEPIVLVDVDPASPERGRAFALRVDWREDLGMIVARPARGLVLRARTTYAAALTSAIRGEDGAALGAEAGFEARRDELAGELEAMGARDVVIATTFTTEDPLGDLRAIRERIEALPPPAITVDRVWHAGGELDDLLGVPSEDRPGIDVAPATGTGGTRSIVHAGLALIVAGRFTAPRVLTGAGTEVGELRRDASGAIEPGPLEDVPFLLTIPAGADLGALPVLVHHHGFNASRVTGLVLSETAARAGVAVLSIDAYQHGERAASAVDEIHAVRGDGVPGPDGLAETSLFDVSARVFGLSGVPRGDELFPGYPLGAFVQFACDAIGAVRVATLSDLAPLRDADPALAGLAFGAVHYAGNSMGSVVGSSVLPVEPRIASAILNVPPGSIVETLVESPEFRTLTDGALLPRLGVDPRGFDEVEHHLALDPIVDLFRWALEPVDPLAHAREMPDAILFQVAALDEVAAPPATRSFLTAVGATRVTVYDPAAHGMLEVRDQLSRYEPPHEPPLIERATPLEFANPLVEIHAEITAFLGR